MPKIPEIAHSIRRVREFAAKTDDAKLKEDLLAVAKAAELAMGMTFPPRL